VIRFFSCLLLALSATAESPEKVQEKAHGRVCISLVEPGSPTKELPFRTTSKAAAGEMLNVYLDASRNCVALVVALSKEGKLANGWRPQCADVPDDYEEIQLPKAPMIWRWSSEAAPLDIYVLFLQPGSKDAEDSKRVITAMQPPNVEESLLAMQTNKLRELIGRLASENEKSNQTLFRDPEVGGVFRGHEFPWRLFAQSVSFSRDQPGVLIVGSEGPGKAVSGGQ
jgi:hypothetical protein